MLVLSRKPGEKIVLSVDGQTVGVITLTRVDRRVRRASLGFELPPNVKILRQELVGKPGRGEEGGQA